VADYSWLPGDSVDLALALILLRDETGWSEEDARSWLAKNQWTVTRRRECPDGPVVYALVVSAELVGKHPGGMIKCVNTRD